MKKIFILLGCMMSSYVTAVQAQRTPFLEAETFVVVPRNEISGSALEPIELPLGKSNPSKAKSIEPEFQEKEVRVKTGIYQNDDIDVMELVRREHAKNVARDEAQEKTKKAQENKKSSVVGSSNSKKPTVVKKKEEPENKIAVAVKSKQEKVSVKSGVKKSSNMGIAVNKSVSLEKPTKAKAKADIKKVSAPSKAQAKVTKKEPVKAKAVTSKAKTNTKANEKKNPIDKSKAVKKPQEKSKK